METADDDVHCEYCPRECEEGSTMCEQCGDEIARADARDRAQAEIEAGEDSVYRD